MTDDDLTGPVPEWVKGLPDEPTFADRGRCTDAGNALRLADRGKDQILYVPGPGWHTWDGKRWKRDVGHLINEHAKATARGIYAEAARAKDDDASKALGKWAHQSESRGRIDAMVALARSEASVRLDDVSQLDAIDNALNVQNGIFDLDAMSLVPHFPTALQTKLARASFRADAECPFWRECLEYFLPDPDVRAWVQMAAGYSMLGTYSEWLFMPYGPGSNFKSTFLWALRYVLGDYACEAAPEILTQRKERNAGTEAAMADLRGMRLVTTIETEQGKKMAEALMKQLTGESRIKAKFMKENYFEFENQTAVWLATNHKPIVQGADYAAWRRIRLVPFEVTVPEAQRKEPGEVKTALALEADGILLWLVEGLRLYRERGSLDPAPAAVDAATAAYREEMDVFGRWFDERCTADSTASVSTAEVVESYKDYCRGNGAIPFGSHRFNEELEQRGFVRTTVRVPDGLVDGKLTTKPANGWKGFTVSS